MGKQLFIDFLLIEKITCHAFESHTHRKSLPNNLEGFLCIFDYYGNHVNPNRVISFKKLYIMALLAGSLLALTIFFLTSSLRTPKILVKEFCYFLMPIHQHGLCIDILVQR